MGSSMNPAAESAGRGRRPVGFGDDAAFDQSGGVHSTGLVVVDGPLGTTGIYGRYGGHLDSDGGVVDALHPSADGGGADATAVVREGSTFTLPLSAAPGAGNYPLTGQTVDWGDGQPDATPTASDTSASHQYTDGGDTDTAQAYAVYGSGTVTKSVPANPVAVQVVDVPARLTAVELDGENGDGEVPAGGTAELSAAFTDPGLGEHHQATVDWGDGTTSAATVYDSGTGRGGIDATHVYADSGSYTATLTVTDDAGGTPGDGLSRATVPLDVTYVAPTFGLTAAPTATAGGAGVSLTLRAAGTNAGGVTGWSVDWGDGTTPTVVPGGGVAAGNRYTWPVPPHVYAAAGHYVISATPADQAGPHAAAVGTTVSVAEPAPTNLTATAVDDEDVRLTWTPDRAAGTQYEVDRQNPDGTWQAIATVDDSTDGDTYTDSGLSGLTTYTYQVRAVGPTPDLDSTYTAPASTKTLLTTPDAPTGLAATESSAGEVDLTWAEDSTIVTGYVVTATPVGGGPAVPFTVDGNVTAVAATGLTAGGQYTFKVVADNNQGGGNDRMSPPSAPFAAVAPAVTLSATAPATVAEGATFTLTVASSVAGSGTSPITGWQVAWGDTSTTDTVNGSNGPDAHTPATAAADSYATVTATDAAGDTFTLPGVFVAVVPLTPSGLATTAVAPTEVDLSWTDHSAVAVDDLVYASTDGGATFQTVGTAAAVAPGSANAYAATGLTSDVPYRFYVVADGGAAQSAPSNTLSAPTPFETPEVTAQGSATAVEGGPYTLDLSAEYPDGEDGAVNHWLVDWGDGNGPQPYPANADPTQPTVVSHTLADAATDQVTVTAVDAVHGPFVADPNESYGLAVTETPVAPGGVTAASGTAADGTGHVTLGWTNTSAFGTGTVILMSSDGGTTFFQQDEVPAGSDPTDTIAGLTLSTGYQFELATDSANGWSATTTPVARTTPAYTPPQLSVYAPPPVEGQTYQLGLSATLPPGLPNSAQVDHYTVDWGDPSAPSIQTFSGSAVTPSHAYPTGTAEAHLVVKAYAVDGTFAVATDQTIRVAPNRPTGLAVAYAADGSSATVTWSAATAIPGVTYAVQRQASVDPATGNPGAWTTVGSVAAAAADGQSHAYTDTLTALSAGEVGSLYRVVATNAGTGSAADAATTATDAIAPVDPAGSPQGPPDLSGVAISVTGDGNSPDAAVMTYPGSPTGSNPPKQYGYDEPVTISVSGMPAHMAYGIEVSLNSSDLGYNGNGIPGDSFTLDGPEGRSTSGNGGGSTGVTLILNVQDDNQSSSAVFHVTPHLPATYGTNNDPVTYTVSVAGPSILRGGVAVGYAFMTKGGVYAVPVSDYVASGDAQPDPITLKVTNYDASLIQPLSDTVTLNANDDGTLLVRAVGGGSGDGQRSGPLELTDEIGNQGSHLQNPSLPTLNTGGTVTVGGTSTAPAAPPTLQFNATASLQPITISYSLTGSTADPSVYSGLDEMATIPAGADHVIVPVTFNYGYQKVSADQTLVVTLPNPDGSDGGDQPISSLYYWQQGDITIVDNNTPTITVAGVADQAQIPIDVQGNDTKLVPIATQVDYFGNLDSTTLSWDPTQDTIWLAKHVGKPGTDLGSQKGAVSNSSTSESYTWYGLPPTTLYAQAINGSLHVDSTAFTLTAAVSLNPTTLVQLIPTANPSKQANGTQSGPEIVYNGKYVTGKTAADVLIGQGIGLRIQYLGPSADPAAQPQLNWGISGKIVSGYDPQVDQSFGAEEWTNPPAELSDSTHFYWTDGGPPGGSTLETVQVGGEYDGESISVETMFAVWRPSSSEVYSGGVAAVQRAAVGWDVGALTTQALANGGQIAGAVIRSHVSQPGPFATGPVGSWYITQLITKNDHATTVPGGTWHINKGGIPDILDTAIATHVRISLRPFTIIGSSAPADGRTYLNTDQPHANSSVPIGDDNHPASLPTHLDRSDSFKDFLMFTPPGNDSIGVPLKKLGWAFNVDGSATANGNWVAAPGASITTSATGVENYSYPIWINNNLPIMWIHD